MVIFSALWRCSERPSRLSKTITVTFANKLHKLLTSVYFKKYIRYNSLDPFNITAIGLFCSADFKEASGHQTNKDIFVGRQLTSMRWNLGTQGSLSLHLCHHKRANTCYVFFYYYLSKNANSWALILYFVAKHFNSLLLKKTTTKRKTVLLFSFEILISLVKVQGNLN